jgi:hypothetical protein
MYVGSSATYARNSGGGIIMGGRGYNYGGGSYYMPYARVSGVQRPDSDIFDGDFVVETMGNGNGNGVLYERMRITSAGRVGIGTANPGVTLEVNGIATFANPWWIITGSGGNATYTTGQVWGSSAVNASFYGSSVFTGGGASAGQWNGATGVFTFPQKGVYSITICMFINGTLSGRWSIMSIASSVSGSSNQYMEFDPTNYAGSNQRNFKIVRYFNANDTFNCYTESGAITLYWNPIHTVYYINKIG